MAKPGYCPLVVTHYPPHGYSINSNGFDLDYLMRMAGYHAWPEYGLCEAREICRCH